MSNEVATKSINDAEKWNQAIQDAEKMLDRFESKAVRLRRTISSLKEFRDAGEPWRSEVERETRAAL